MEDVIIVGAGPAGLNAALLLGRCRRRVVVFDAGEPRNARSRGVGGFLSRDGTLPHELRQLGQNEVAAYPTVTMRTEEVASAAPQDGGFAIALVSGERMACRKLILATGLGNDAPEIPDAQAFYGRGLYPCPYCDGWEHRDEPIAAFGHGRGARGIALELTGWSRDVVLLTDGGEPPPAAHRRDLQARGIEVIEDRITRLEGEPDREGLRRIHLAGGRVLDRRGIFFEFDSCRQSPLVGQLGCELSREGAVETGHCEKTNVPGLFVAGDASRRVKFAIVAAAEGALAAFAANTELLKEDLAASAPARRPDNAKTE